MITYLITGGLIGLSVLFIQTLTIPNFYYRPNNNNDIVFTPYGLIELMKLPLTTNYDRLLLIYGLHRNMTIWDRLNMVSLNWVCLLIIGIIIRYFI